MSTTTTRIPASIARRTSVEKAANCRGSYAHPLPLSRRMWSGTPYRQ
jgi:hypothetical protein